MNDSYSVISILGGIQGILLSPVFLVKKTTQPARFLGWYLFVFSLGLFETYVRQFGDSRAGAALSGLLGFSSFLYGPLLFLFIRRLAAAPTNTKNIFHFLPFIIGYAANLFSIFIYDPFPGREEGLPELILFELFVIQILTYNFKAIDILSRYKPVILQTYSSIEDKDLSWLRYFLLGITGIYILSFSITHLLIFGYVEAQRLYVAVQLSVTVSIYLMSYKIVFQPGLLGQIRADLPTKNKTSPKYAKSPIGDEQLIACTSELMQYLEHKKPYMDADLTIYTLAEKLAMSKNKLTQVINEGTGKTFYELINYYRVEEAKNLLLKGELNSFTVSAIGAKAGFKSKTAFHTNFKKFTGITPIEWKKQQEEAGGIAMGAISAE